LRDRLGKGLLPLNKTQPEQFRHRALHRGSILSQRFPDPPATIPACIFDEVQEDVGFQLVEAEKALEEVVDRQGIGGVTGRYESIQGIITVLHRRERTVSVNICSV
jgi:hypothetical protein